MTTAKELLEWVSKIKTAPATTAPVPTAAPTAPEKDQRLTPLQTVAETQYATQQVIDFLAIVSFKDHLEAGTGLKLNGGTGYNAIHKQSNSQRSSVVVTTVWATKDLSTIFQLRVFINDAEIRREGLATVIPHTGLKKYEMFLSIDVVYEGRVVKWCDPITTDDWNFLDSPEKIFPYNRLKSLAKKSGKKRTFQRRDMEAGLRCGRVKGQLSTNRKFFNMFVGKDNAFYLQLQRYSVGSAVEWRVHYKVRENNAVGQSWVVGSIGLSESEESLEWLSKIQRDTANMTSGEDISKWLISAFKQKVSDDESKSESFLEWVSKVKSSSQPPRPSYQSKISFEKFPANVRSEWFVGVKVVYQGQKYGLKNVLTNNDEEPLVEFWDTDYTHDEIVPGERGQFITRYLLTQVIGTPTSSGFQVHGGGISLQGGVAKWKLDSSAIADIVVWLAKETAGLKFKPKFEF